jgi:hypothetical protein
LAVEAHLVREAYRAVAQRAEYQEGQDDQPDADVLTMCARDDGPATRSSLVFIVCHRGRAAMPLSSCARIILASSPRMTQVFRPW